MTKTVRMRYEKGMLKPLKLLGLEEGGEVVVMLREDPVNYVHYTGS